MSLRIKPTYWSAYNAGVLLGKINNYKGALGCLNEAVKLDSTHAEAYLKRGNVYHLLGDDAAAMVQFNKAIRIKPEFGEAYQSMALVMYEKDSLDNRWCRIHRFALMRVISCKGLQDHLSRQSYNRQVIEYFSFIE